MGTGWCRHGDRHAPGCSREACVRMADCQEARVAVHASPVTSIHHLLSWRRAWSGGRGAGGGVGRRTNSANPQQTSLSVRLLTTKKLGERSESCGYERTDLMAEWGFGWGIGIDGRPPTISDPMKTTLHVTAMYPYIRPPSKRMKKAAELCWC